MRRWDTADDLAFLATVVHKLKKGQLVAPDSMGMPTPLDLRGLEFATVMQCEALQLPEVVAHFVIGRQEFNDGSLRDVDLSKSRLDFSVWNNCSFERVCFDGAMMNHVRFFGCRFQDCTFRKTTLRDASFSVGRIGIETEVVSTIFDRSDFRGASCDNPVFRSTSFLNCKLNGFVFDGALCDRVVFSGKYIELTFRGIPGDTERNRLRIDLTNARLMWLNADYGIDLSSIIPPADGSCLVIKDRIRAIATLCSRLLQVAGEGVALVARSLNDLFSDEATSPLKSSQETLLISREMIADFAETQDPNVVDFVFNSIRTIGRAEGFLVA